MARRGSAVAQDGIDSLRRRLRGYEFAGWQPPIQDPIVVAELRKATRTRLGVEVETELSIMEASAQASSDASAGSESRTEVDAAEANTTSGGACSSTAHASSLSCAAGAEPDCACLLAGLPVLARLLELVAAAPASAAGGGILGRAAGSAAHVSAVLLAIAATCTRFSSACHLLRTSTCARRLARLDRSLQFREHADFEPAEVDLDDVKLDLEVAADFLDLEADDLRALMSSRSPPSAAPVVLQALYTLLLQGRPSHAELRGFTGDWSRDRLILDPTTLLPLVDRAANPSADVVKRLRAMLCASRQALTPATILASADAEATAAYSAALKATAAIAQWIWVQVATQEIDAPVGTLEKALLLQPSQAKRRIERHREIVQRQLNGLRSDKLQLQLLGLGPQRVEKQCSPTRRDRRRNGASGALDGSGVLERAGANGESGDPGRFNDLDGGDGSAPSTRPATSPIDGQTSRIGRRVKLGVFGHATLNGKQGPQHTRRPPLAAAEVLNLLGFHKASSDAWRGVRASSGFGSALRLLSPDSLSPAAGHCASSSSAPGSRCSSPGVSLARASGGVGERGALGAERNMTLRKALGLPTLGQRPGSPASRPGSAGGVSSAGRFPRPLSGTGGAGAWPVGEDGPASKFGSHSLSFSKSSLPSEAAVLARHKPLLAAPFGLAGLPWAPSGMAWVSGR